MVTRKQEGGAIIVVVAIAIIALVMLVALAFKSWWIFSEDIKLSAIAKISASACIRQYQASAGVDYASKAAEAMPAATTIAAMNFSSLRLGVYADAVTPVPALAVDFGIWNFGNSPDCDGNGGGCFTISADVSQVNACSFAFTSKVGASKLFGSVLPGSDKPVFKQSIFAFDSSGLVRNVYNYQN